jgi:AraC-like DNA-binding protein
MQNGYAQGYAGASREDRHERSFYPISTRDAWHRYTLPAARGFMVFDYKGRLVKADACAERTMAALGVELNCTPRLRISALDASDAQRARPLELPEWLDPKWIEPVIEGDDRLGTVVQVPASIHCGVSAARRGVLPAYKLRRAIAFIEAHLDQAIRLADLACEVHSSPFHFHRQFKQSTGLPPGRYIAQRRILVAKELLSDSGLPIIEVAARVGFVDQSHFTTVFKQATSMTPGSYRKATVAAR